MHKPIRRQTKRQYHAALRKNARIVARFVDENYEKIVVPSMRELDAMFALASYFERASDYLSFPTSHKKVSR